MSHPVCNTVSTQYNCATVSRDETSSLCDRERQIGNSKQIVSMRWALGFGQTGSQFTASTCSIRTYLFTKCTYSTVLIKCYRYRASSSTLLVSITLRGFLFTLSARPTIRCSNFRSLSWTRSRTWACLRPVSILYTVGVAQHRGCELDHVPSGHVTAEHDCSLVM
jgi:hypothetical protein